MERSRYKDRPGHARIAGSACSTGSTTSGSTTPAAKHCGITWRPAAWRYWLRQGGDPEVWDTTRHTPWRIAETEHYCGLVVPHMTQINNLGDDACDPDQLWW